MTRRELLFAPLSFLKGKPTIDELQAQIAIEHSRTDVVLWILQQHLRRIEKLEYKFLNPGPHPDTITEIDNHG